jgi:hypothetical protein
MQTQPTSCTLKDAFGIQNLNILHVLFLSMVPQIRYQNAKTLVQGLVQNIIGNVMTCVFQSLKNAMESVCQSSLTVAMVFVFQLTSRVIAFAFIPIIRLIATDNAFTQSMRKN